MDVQIAVDGLHFPHGGVLGFQTKERKLEMSIKGIVV
jgi:hypothetical protein